MKSPSKLFVRLTVRTESMFSNKISNSFVWVCLWVQGCIIDIFCRKDIEKERKHKKKLPKGVGEKGIEMHLWWWANITTTHLLMNTLHLWFKILLTLSFIFSFSASSKSAIRAIESTLMVDPNTLILSVSMGVLANKMVAFSMRFGWWTPGFLSNRKPSSKNESSNVPPVFLMMWMALRSPDPFRRSTASTANFEKNLQRTKNCRKFVSFNLKDRWGRMLTSA